MRACGRGSPTRSSRGSVTASFSAATPRRSPIEREQRAARATARIDQVADRTLALLDGFGVRTLIGDSTIPLARARRSVSAALAAELGLGERLVSGDSPAAEGGSFAADGSRAADLRSTA